MTEIIEGDCDVRCLHSLREVEEIVVGSSTVNGFIKIIFFFIIFFVFLVFLLFFIFIKRWLLILIIRIGEIVNLVFSLRIKIVGPLNSDWPSRLDGVLTLSVDILEKVES